MATCEACGGSGKCSNPYHDSINENRGVAGTLSDAVLGSCPDCGDWNTEMGGKCTHCNGTGEA